MTMLIFAGNLLANLVSPAWAEEKTQSSYKPATTSEDKEAGKLNTLWLERQAAAQAAGLSDEDIARLEAAITAAENAKASANSAAGSATSASNSAKKAADAAKRAEAAAAKLEHAPPPPVVTQPAEVVETPPEQVVEEPVVEPEPESVIEEQQTVVIETPPPDTAQETAPPPEQTVARKVDEKHGRGSIFAGVTAGIAFNGDPIEDAGGTVVAGPVSAPVQAWGGWMYAENGTDEHRGLGLGVVGHGGIDPVNLGTNAGIGFAVMSLNTRGGGWGLSLGYGYSGYESLDAGANAWVHGVEALGLFRKPIGRTDRAMVTDMFVYAGAHIGVLANEGSGVFGAFPMAGVGLEVRRQGSRLAIIADEDK